MKILRITTAMANFPDGTAEVVKTKLWVFNAGGTQVHEDERTDLDFPWPSLPLGDYAIKAESRDAAGERIGQLFVGQVTWNNTVQRPVPVGCAIIDVP